MNPYREKWINWQWIGLAVRVYLGVIFILASWHKIMNPGIFALDVATYQLLPLWAVNGLGWTPPSRVQGVEATMPAISLLPPAEENPLTFLIWQVYSANSELTR